jgi:invasion protein IalB
VQAAGIESPDSQGQFHATPCPRLLADLSPSASACRAPAIAQQSGAVRSTHGAWAVDLRHAPRRQQRALRDDAERRGRRSAGNRPVVVVLRTADGTAEILRVLAPLGVLLPNGLGLNIDGQDIGRAYFVRCFDDGCYAEVILEEPLLGNLRDGDLATFIVFQTPEEGIGIPVELEGFRSGYDALP